ncbi:hypothetical protein [Streptomyces pseudovenezuelae]|uniref:hypothetical protein n=1 Tax=Streptomyces pseudovenezuelae TaxID=67350 RepID=UPI002E81776F|nr:hypothetical protein [Streptomyces pseudovenezuelae]WUA87542.1 IS110 family transposase [Streptomyces pseudovenezuelae]
MGWEWLEVSDALQAVIDRLDTLLAEMSKTECPSGDVDRFSSARKLASCAGLTPTVRGPDRTVPLRACTAP